jgi:hypothetical protein
LITSYNIISFQSLDSGIVKNSPWLSGQISARKIFLSATKISLLLDSGGGYSYASVLRWNGTVYSFFQQAGHQGSFEQGSFSGDGRVMVIPPTGSGTLRIYQRSNENSFFNKWSGIAPITRTLSSKSL